MNNYIIVTITHLFVYIFKTDLNKEYFLIFKINHFINSLYSLNKLFLLN